MSKSKALFFVGALSAALLAGCTDAEVASRNLSKAADDMFRDEASEPMRRAV